MSKDPNKNPDRSIENYYDLKTEAVDALMNAETDDADVSEEELDKYRKKKFHIPEVVKIMLIKAWFAGAVYYFIGFGLGITNLLDQIVIMGVVLGLVTDLLTNNVIRFLEETPGSNDRWMLFPSKSYACFFFNMIYGIVLLIGVAGVYLGLEKIADLITGEPDIIHIGTEPLLFGVFCMLLDMLLVTFKNLIRNAIKGRK